MTVRNQSQAQAMKSIFLALQGGGAKGVIHVGALLAINELKLNIKGVSGTSAGSIVAALIAVGFSGVELADPDNETHFFQNAMFGEGYGKLNYRTPRDLFT